MLINIWPDDWKTQLEMMNLKVDEYNGKALEMVNGRYIKILRFSSNEFWNNIGCIV